MSNKKGQRNRSGCWTKYSRLLDI